MRISTLEELQSEGLRIPSEEFIKRTLQPLSDICPGCRQARTWDDMIYITREGLREAVCWHCAYESDLVKDIGVRTVIRESEDYIKDMIAQVLPSKWMLKRLRKGSTTNVRQFVNEGTAYSLRLYWEPCIGKFSRIEHVNGMGYLDTHLPCTSGKLKMAYFTRIGSMCSLCVSGNARDKRDFQNEIDRKERMRLVCEGLRYAAWLSKFENRLISMSKNRARPWEIDWIDWRTGDIETTKHTEDYPFVPQHNRRRYKI